MHSLLLPLAPRPLSPSLCLSPPLAPTPHRTHTLPSVVSLVMLFSVFYEFSENTHVPDVVFSEKHTCA